jgi:hypothetical protein
MGYTKRIICSLALVFVLQQLVAQQVLITIGVTPPFSPYLSNYTSTDANKIFMTLQNTTNRTIQLRLTGSAVGDNGVSIKSKPGFISSSSITLTPFQVRQMNGTALSEVFDLNNFDVTGIDRNTLARTLRLPEGNYNLCVQAVDYNSGQLLSGGAPLGCTLLTIAYPEPPVLVSPLPGDSVNSATPQALVFSWMNPGSVPVGTEYTLQLQEMPQPNANPNQVLAAASFPLLSQRVKTTSYVYSVGNLALKKGSKYAWRIVASDPSGRITFKNNGVSAAGVFGYGRSTPEVSGITDKIAVTPPPKIISNKVEINGTLRFQYHISALATPAGFTGVTTEELPLAKEQVQLCYGLCRVKMSLVPQLINKVVANSALKNTTLPKDVKVAPVGKDSSRLTFYHTDSIPSYGLPTGLYSVEAAGNAAGGLGQVIATTITDETGAFNFSAYTTKWSSIVETYGDDVALVYCYYINVKNKHYTDPRNYIYIPVENANNPVSVGFAKVYLDNYKLTVHVNRDREAGTNQGKTQNVSVENKADGMADIYILRKGSSANTPVDVPGSEGDNTGKIKFLSQADKQPVFTKFSPYSIIAKRTVATSASSNWGANSFGATATFNNLVNNLDNKESYYVYVEYKGSSIYFDPQEYNFQPDDLAEYRPRYSPVVNEQSVEIKPTYVAIRIKGVLKYQFKNRTPAPLANVTVSFRNIYWYSGNPGGGKYEKVYDLENKLGHNVNYVTSTTDANGTFELNAGAIDYDSYHTGFAFIQGLEQFITVDNCYYGSPDKAFNFETGNTYNVGELIAQVKEYSLSPVIKGKNGQTGLMQNLPGQRVYLCRKADANPKLWGVPADECMQKDVPSKEIKDVDGVAYNVLGYGITDQSGKAAFTGLVANDLEKSEDQYYLYSESAVTSSQNYSTQYGVKAGVVPMLKSSWSYYYTNTKFVFNATVQKGAYALSPNYAAVALAPYIEGGVYPQSNTSTNALPNVEVRLYDIPTTGISAATFENKLNYMDVMSAVTQQKWTVQYKMNTNTNGSFYFGDLTANGKSGWKLLVYSKAGFITGYTVVNSGKPMVVGTKQTVKGFVLPPQLVHVKVKDGETGTPIAANIVVGDQFSWGSQDVLTSITKQGQTYVTNTFTSGVDLTTPYGQVKFTVIPEDNVHYRTQTFTQTVKAPAKGTTQQATMVTQNLGDFEMTSRRNRIIVCLLDAETKKGLAGTVAILDVPAAVNPAAQPVFLLKDHCKEFSFASTQSTYRVQVTSHGYATKTITVNNNTEEDVAQDLMVKMEPGISVNGTVKVDGKAVKDAKVYIQELSNLPEVLTDDKGYYYLDGLPKNNAKVTLTAVKPDMNAIGQTKTITLGYGSSSTSSSGSSSGTGNVGKIPVITTITKPINIKGVIDKNKISNDAVTQPANQQLVNFDLKTNKDIDLSTLYGFPLEVEGLDTRQGNTFLTGRIRIAGNNSFAIDDKQPYLHFTNVKVVAPAKSELDERLQNYQPKTKAKMITASGKVEIDDDEVPVTVFGKYSAALNAFEKGIMIESQSTTSGIVTGTVLFTSDGVAGNVQWDGATSLAVSAQKLQTVSNRPAAEAQRKKRGAYSMVPARSNQLVEMSIPVFISGTALQNKLVASYYFENEATALYYRLNNMYDADASAKSYLAADGLHLITRLHTQLENVAKPDLAITIGEVKVTNTAMATLNGTDTISIPLDSWQIRSHKWFIKDGPLQMNGNLEAGAITLPVLGLEVSESTIGFGDLKLDKIGVAGVYKLDIDQSQTLTSFGYDKAAQYGTLYDKKYGCWSLSLLPKNADNALTQLAGLPDLAQGDKLSIMNISLYSKGGESRIILKQNHPSVTLNGFAGFKPYEVENGKDYLKINGALSFNIPGFSGTENAPYTLSYAASGNKLVHKHEPIAGLKLTTNGIRTEFGVTGQVFTGNRLELKGLLKDKVANSPYTLAVKFVKEGSSVQLDVDTTAKDVVSLGAGQQMKKITGNMAMSGSQWNNFKFEGDLAAEGMTAEKPSHMGFEVKGDLVANKAELGVKNMPLPSFLDGSFNLTYDFDKKAVVGSMQLNNVSTPAADFSAAIEMMMGNGQWYLLGAINVQKLKVVPLPLNGASAAFCLGYAPLSPDKLQIIQPVFHNGELPNDFSSKFSQIKGALFVAGVDFKLPLPNLDLDLGVASVHVGYGIYGNAYAGLNFDESAPIVDGGVKVGAYVNVSGGASIGIACAGVSLGAEINAQGNLHMELPPLKGVAKYLNPKTLLTDTKVELNVQLEAILKGSAYVGVGICNSSCNSVKVWGVTIPPGCHKESIGKTLSVSGGITVTKSKGALTPDAACIYLNLFGTSYPGIDPNTGKRPNNISIPNL